MQAVRCRTGYARRVKKPGELSRIFQQQLFLDKPWVPVPEFFSKFIIKFAGTDLQHKAGALLTPTHLLFLDHPLGYYLVDG
jgi:hypothetical protein